MRYYCNAGDRAPADAVDAEQLVLDRLDRLPTDDLRIERPCHRDG
jgi:hypothetical protein